jgi:GTP-binding protein
MSAVVALVGRPNVGKSTLFNQLTRSRDALVADFPGLTRDRQYGLAEFEGRGFVVIDTGGLEGEQSGVAGLMATQTRQAIAEADVVIFLVDAREGLSAADEGIATELRSTGKRVLLALNKTDGLDPLQAATEFHALGLGEPMAIAAAHGRGIATLVERALGELPPPEAPDAPPADSGLRLAFVGRPNVGKSTLVNRLLGEERVVASDLPGTTRDSIFVPFERDGRRYTLIDTAGVRRRARVRETIEKFSVVKTLQAIDAAHVVVLVLDAREGVGEQDAHLLGLILRAGRALVIAVNKWDGLEGEARERIRRELDLRLGFVDFAETRFCSALHGSGVGELLGAVQRAQASAQRDLATPELTRVLEAAVAAHQPPLVQGRRIKIRYAHQGGRNPPVIVLHGNQLERLPGSYLRYLENRFRKDLGLSGTPLRLELRTGRNPYAGRRPKPGPRRGPRRRG